MDLKKNAFKSIGTGWLRMGIHMIVGFFLAPFILHRLGDYAFGLYMLVYSFVGYYGLFDLGIRSSIIHYVARFTATGEQDELNQFINSALFVYGSVAAVLIVITATCATLVGRIFHIRPDFLTDARLLFLMVGVGIALNFPLGLFEGVLEGLQRFPWMDYSLIGNSLLRLALIVLALTHGLGLLTVALITVGLNLLRYGVYAILTFQNLPLRLRWKSVDRKSMRMMVHYSLPTFVMGIAEQLNSGSNETVIGIFLSSVAITYFSIGSKLVGYTTNLVTAVISIFNPMAAHFHAMGNVQALHKIHVEGSRFCALAMFPLCVLLIMLGKPMITLWVGARYVAASYPILLILIIPTTLGVVQGVSIRILYGMDRHRWMAVVRVGSAGVNLLLSILLVGPMGIVGVALGTAIPSILSCVLFYPIHTCRILKMPVLYYLRHAFLLPLALCAPLAGVVFALTKALPAPSYASLILEVFCGGVVYCGIFAWVFLTREPMGVQVRGKLVQYFQQAFGR